MRFADIGLHLSPLPGAMPVSVATATDAQWSALAQAASLEGWRLVSLWGSDRRDTGDGFVVHAAYGTRTGLASVRLPLAAGSEYPDLSASNPAATRMQRALFDLLGVAARGADDRRAWLRHAAWPADYFPLRRDSDGPRAF